MPKPPAIRAEHPDSQPFCDARNDVDVIETAHALADQLAGYARDLALELSPWARPAYWQRVFAILKHKDQAR